MSNGLCKLTDYVVNAINGQSTFVRGSCSDKNWGSSCPNFCVTTSHGDTLEGAMGVAQCDGNTMDSYYCLDRAVDSFTSTATGSDQASSMLCTNSNYLIVFQGGLCLVHDEHTITGN
jgi:hypothetical protein